MSFPALTEPSKASSSVGQFGGLNQRLEPSMAEFADMKNVSSANYPALSTRPQRGTGSTIANPNGIFWKNALFYVSGTTCYYNGSVISGLTVTNSAKTLIGMGAYVVIFPDKKAYNTSTGAVKDLEASYTQASSISFDLLSEDSVYCKITATGIGNSFSKNDNVTIAGVSHSQAASYLNASKVITDQGTDYITVTAAIGTTYQSTDTVTISADNSKAKIAARDINDSFEVGDKVKIYGCTNSALNVDTTVTAKGTDYIIVNVSWSTTVTQTDVLTVKRTGFTQASGITFTREVPDMDFVCEHNNRLWGCSSTNHEIYASKLGDPWNWNNYEGISTDSYTLTIGSDGDFTGCVSHGGYVIFFKENTIHVMYGDKPSNYSLNTKALPGVRTGCAKSLQVVNETLYYVGRNGIYSYDGATPTKISANITADISDAVACQCGGKYYLSCLMDNTRTLLVYDPNYGFWHREDGTQYKFTAYGNGTGYYIDGDNKLCTIYGADTGTIEWYVESGDIVESSLTEKYISKVLLNFWLDQGSEANFYFKYDEEASFKRQGVIRSTKNTTYMIPVIPRRCNKFRYRIEGKGNFKLLGLAWTVEGGSELNGSIQHQHRLLK